VYAQPSIGQAALKWASLSISTHQVFLVALMGVQLQAVAVAAGTAVSAILQGMTTCPTQQPTQYRADVSLLAC
jgi:hypothetical protein